MKTQNNPAANLYDLLSRMTNTTDDRQPAFMVLAAAFGVDPKYSEKFFWCLSQLARMIEDTKRAINGIDNIDKELFLKPFPNIEKLAYSRNFEFPWSHFRSALDGETLLGLQHCVHELSRTADQVTLSAENIQELQVEVENLIKDLLTSDIQSELKNLLLEKLEAVRTAILYYRVRGIDGIREATEAAIGAMFLNGLTITAEMTQNEEKGILIRRLWNWWVKLGQATSTFKNVVELGQSFLKLLNQGN